MPAPAWRSSRGQRTLLAAPTRSGTRWEPGLRWWRPAAPTRSPGTRRTSWKPPRRSCRAWGRCRDWPGPTELWGVRECPAWLVALTMVIRPPARCCPRNPVKERCVADCRADTDHREHPTWPRLWKPGSADGIRLEGDDSYPARLPERIKPVPRRRAEAKLDAPGD